MDSDVSFLLSLQLPYLWSRTFSRAPLDRQTQRYTNYANTRSSLIYQFVGQHAQPKYLRSCELSSRSRQSPTLYRSCEEQTLPVRLLDVHSPFPCLSPRNPRLRGRFVSETSPSPPRSYAEVFSACAKGRIRLRRQ